MVGDILNPRITALMTTYNAEKWVDEAIQSILQQTASDFEFLIIDDGSSDNTVSQIKSYNDSRIRLIAHCDNKGVGARLDEALDMINTPFIAKVDADDISEPGRFEKQLSFLQDNSFSIVKCLTSYFPDTEVVEKSTRYQYFISEKQGLLNGVTEPKKIADTLRQWFCVLHTSYFALTSAVKQVRYPHTRIFEDYILFLRLKNAGHLIGCVNEYLVNVRVSEGSTTATLGLKELEEGVLGIIDEKWPDFTTLIANKRVYIFGTGNMALACTQCLSTKGVDVDGFVEKEQKSKVLEINGHNKEIIGLSQYINKDESRIIIIAAQPVRSLVINELEKAGMYESEDYLVLA